jgi:predicted ATPase
MGKSRLLMEFRHRAGGRPVSYLEGHCRSYGRAVPYLPVRDLLRAHCGITEADTAEVITTKVHRGLQEVALSPEEGAPYLLQLLGIVEGTESLAMLTPEAIQARTFEILCQMYRRGSQQRPLIIVVEDLHWIDAPSEALLAALVERLVGAPILFLATYRPGYQPPWVDRSSTTQIALHRLPATDSRTVVQAVAHQEPLSEALMQTILTRAEGNPLFLEELTRAVLEQGALRTDMPVPETIQGVLMARIDRLPEAAKRAFQTASVLGREVSVRLLERLWEGPGDLPTQLQTLKRLELLYERPEAEEPVYVFKHPLTQEVAYDSLLLTRRQSLHAAAGRALETLYMERREEISDRLAYHYTRTTEAAKAAEYLTRLAEQAERECAHAEAVTALQEAMGHSARFPIEAPDQPLPALNGYGVLPPGGVLSASQRDVCDSALRPSRYSDGRRRYYAGSVCRKMVASCAAQSGRPWRRRAPRPVYVLRRQWECVCPRSAQPAIRTARHRQPAGALPHGDSPRGY